MGEHPVTRKAVRIALVELVELLPHAVDEFFTDFRCRLCRHRSGALDRETALNEAAAHLAAQHHAQGGHHRKPRARQTRRSR